MSLYGVITILHVIGAAIGVGGATAADTLFLRSIRNRRVSTDQYNLLRSIQHVVMTGLAIVVLSGIALALHNFAIIREAEFLAKMIIVLLLILNGFVFYLWVKPWLNRHRDERLSTDTLRRHIPVFAVAGPLSIVSWYTALILGVMGRLGHPLWVYLVAYAALLVVGIVGGYLVLSHILFSPLSAGAAPPESERATPEATRPRQAIFSWSVAILAVLLLLFVATLAVAGNRGGQTHVVSIIEPPPWFTPSVLRIQPGDRVVWTHNPVDRHGVPPTHPVHMVDGPRFFSSNMRPVARTEDGWGFSVTFHEPGIYEYVCPTHPYMRGIVAVGVEPEEDSLWPPDEKIPAELNRLPPAPGVGEIWINTQYEEVPGQTFPGTITVIDAATWQVTDVLAHESFNNPHNLRSTYDGRYFFQTQWHTDVINKIDIQSKQVLQTKRITSVPLLSRIVERLPERVGTAPAHVFVDPRREVFYLTLNNDNRIFELDFDLNIRRSLRTSFGPHGVWVDPAGRWMVLAATLDEKLDIIDLDAWRVAATFDAPGLPLAAEITHDGRYAMISLLLEGKVRFIDLRTMQHVKDVEVGEQPIWPRPGPDGRHVWVPNTGTADISIIDLESLEVVKTIPAANGAHGITFCRNAAGGWYGYFSNKYARVVGVVDAERQETVGYIPLPETAWGGNGIYCLPDNEYNQFLHRRQ